VRIGEEEVFVVSKGGILLFVGLLAPTLATSQPANAPKPGETITLNAQADSSEWEQNEHFRKFYPLSVEMLGRGIDDIDVELYEQRSYAIFRTFANSIGVDVDGMVDHLKNIPREMVEIVKRDPTVLESYESFLIALRGPR
jgi:hypothetical protein